MIRVLDVALQTRLMVADAERIKWSDWEVEQAVTAVCQALSWAFETQTVPEGLSVVEMTKSNDEPHLVPEDFWGVASVQVSGSELRPNLESRPQEGEYRVRGRTLETPERSLTLTYWRDLSPKGGWIDVANRFALPLARAAAAVLQSKWEEADKILTDSAKEAKTLSSGRLDWAPAMWGG